MPKAKVVHGAAKAPPPKQSTAGSTPTFTVDNTPRAKMLRMGLKYPVRSSGGPSTGA